MNCLLFTHEQILATHNELEFRVQLDQRQLQHIHEVHRAQLGDTLRVGLLGGRLGEGSIVELSHDHAELNVSLTHDVPAKTGATLLLALPRPKMLKRIVQMVCTLGVDHLVLLNSYRVEKSYWQSPFLTADALHEQLLLGLEQAGDSVLPKVTLAQRFKPFVEDDLPAILQGKQGFVAHPMAQALPCPCNLTMPLVLAIGPEGGFIPYEADKLQAAGMQVISLGPRILRVETAVAVVLGRMLSC
ncbi:MAG: 16S rRNA (uracil(1498)-N(3))-methyltransferase [Moraxellaceae bacterium]|nr:16S rRNA (uracil(1498)-N(3))-methyltransferase [Moraxellaceae bacterium]MDZ4385609.1 16S rRNA (uracil(1498)-N(3))-methyltransferase [Moraxellaceae bacterium]